MWNLKSICKPLPSKKSQGTPVKICFAGCNKPIDQWFLEKNFNSEFEAAMKRTFPLGAAPEKEDLKIWIKSINQECKWKLSYRIGYYIAKLLPWPFNNWVQTSFQKKVARRVKKKVDDINHSLGVCYDHRCKVNRVDSAWP